MPTLKIQITIEEKMALVELSNKMLRDPRQQAYLIIRKELEHLGYIQSSQDNPTASIVNLTEGN